MDLAELFADGAEKVFAAGETIIHPGTGDDQVYLVEAGRVRISRISPDGQELTLAVAGPGEILGEVALIDGGERTAAVIAQTEVKVRCLTRSEFLRIISREPGKTLGLIATLCNRLRQADEMLEDLSFLGVKERLARLLARLAAKGLAPDEFTHQELAEMIGASRESVTRALGEMHREAGCNGGESKNGPGGVR